MLKHIPAIYITSDMRAYEIQDKVFTGISYALNGEQGYTLNDISKERILGDGSEKSKALLLEIQKRTKLLSVKDMRTHKEFQLMKLDDDSLGGMSPVEKIIALYKQVYKNPVFFVDCLQQMQIYLGLEARAGTNYILSEFKNYSSKHQVAIILVSFLNREGYNKDVESNHFKESGSIEYDCDTILAIQPHGLKDSEAEIDMDDFKSHAIRPTLIKCIKSRASGYSEIIMQLNTEYCTFEEYNPELAPDLKYKKRKNSKKSVLNDIEENKTDNPLNNFTMVD